MHYLIYLVPKEQFIVSNQSKHVDIPLVQSEFGLENTVSALEQVSCFKY